jgi:OmpA-OmpF porin, OOP family
METRARTLGLVILGSLLATSAVAAPNRGFYVGAGAGRINVEDDITGFDDGDVGFKIFGGYVLNEIVSAEISYIDGGTAEEPISFFDGLGGIATAKFEVDTSVINLSILGDLLLTEQFSLFGRLGYAFIDTDIDVNAQSPLGGAQRFSDSDNSDEVSYGIGVVYRFTQQFEVRAEYEGFDISDGELNGFTASALFRF